MKALKALEQLSLDKILKLRKFNDNSDPFEALYLFKKVLILC